MRTAIDNGYLTVTPSGTLRIEANGALIEGQSTNLALQSEALGNATNWVATNMTVDNNTVQAPTGDNTAETLTASGDNATLLQSYTGTVAAYTGSYYLKRKTGTGDVSVSADNTTGTVCTINASTWTRCYDTATLSVAAYSPGIHIATSGDAVYAFGGDMELGAFANSYIPTTTAAVTRNRDDLRFQASGNISGTTGTVAMRLYFNPAIPSGAEPIYILEGNVETPTRLILREWANHLNDLALYDGTNVLSGALSLSGDSYKNISVSYAGSGAILALNGTTEAQVFDGDFNLGTNLLLGARGATYSNQLFGHIKNLRVWNRAFTDAELVTISTP
jgi:hypothetical protein